MLFRILAIFQFVPFKLAHVLFSIEFGHSFQAMTEIVRFYLKKNAIIQLIDTHLWMHLDPLPI